MSIPVLLEPTFADAIAAIEGAPDLSDQIKQHWTCSLRQIARGLDRPLESIPGRWTAVRLPISRLHRVLAGNREKTLQNHKANARRALLWFAGEHDVPARGTPLTSEWRLLAGRVPDRGQRARLSGLIRYCSAQAISPDQVSESALDGYMAYRAATTSLNADMAARRSVARSWNGCVENVLSWPSNLLDEPPIKATVGPQWEEFPEGLRQELELYLQSLGRFRRSAGGKRIRPCKASTIRTRRAELVAVIKTAAWIVPLESITSFRVLLQPDLVEQILDAYWTKDGESPGTFTIDLAWKLMSIARETGVLDADALARLDDMRAELETHRQIGLTAKNQSLIRQVLSDGVWTRVVRLPWELMKQARQVTDHAPVKAAVIAQIAMAVAILSVAPVRLGNLGRIRLGENLIKPGGVDGPYWLVFPQHEVKNDVTLEFPLDQHLTDLIDEYVHDFRPALARGSNEPWLFPGDGTFNHKGLATLGTQIMQRIEDATGLRITVHQFRHASAAILLKHRPGAYELVRRLLGHRNIQTTIRFYCGLETIQATEIFGAIVRGQLALAAGDH